MLKNSADPICIFGDCKSDEKHRSLAGYPYCTKHFWFSWMVIEAKDGVPQIHALESLMYWITWHLYRKHGKSSTNI